MLNVGASLLPPAESPDPSVSFSGNDEVPRDPDRFDEEHFAAERKASFQRLVDLPGWGYERREPGGPSPDDWFLQSP
jgi:hypothetical protein